MMNRAKLYLWRILVLSWCGVFLSPGALFVGAEPHGQSSVVWFEGRALAAPASRPLFPKPRSEALTSVVDFVGRDQDIVSRMDFSSQAVQARLAKIQATEQRFRSLKPKSREAMVAGIELADLYAEQAYYLENLRGMGLGDKRYPDLKHFSKVWRGKLVSLSRRLAADYPQSSFVRKWRVSVIESGMRVGDDSQFRDFSNLAKNDPSAPDTVRLRALGVGLAEMRATQNNYGTVQNVLSMGPDAHSAAALKLILAEKQAAKNIGAAVKLYQEAAQDGLGLKRPGGSVGPITARAAWRLLERSLAAKPKKPNPEVVTFLESMGLPEHLKYYVEQCALANLPQNTAAAAAGYDELAGLSVTNEAEKFSINLRTLDLALAKGDLRAIEERWSRLAQTPSKMQDKEVAPRVAKTQALAWAAFSKRPSSATAEQFVRLHDGFASTIAAYAAQDTWEVRAVEALFKTSNFSESSKRADRLAQKSKDKSVRLAAMRFSARSKEKLLGISDSPSFAASPKLGGDSELVSQYVAVLIDLVPMVSGAEREKAAFQAVYLSYVVKGREQAKADFAKTIGTYPRSGFAPRAAAFLLSDASAQADYVYVETLSRSLEKWKVRPSDKRFSNLRAVVEVAVFEQAKALEEQNKHSEAADKYVAFQKEFPASKKADVALHQASRNYTSASQIDKSIGQMESLLENYPKSPLAKETRWSAAEQSKSIGQLLRAANHYAAFASQYRKEGYDRKAWLLSAELHKGLGRFSHAIAGYEQYLNAAQRKEDKIAAAREIASMQHKYGSTADALASYDRVIKLGGEPKDSAWAHFHITEIMLRQGLEREARVESRKLLSSQASDDEVARFKAKIRHSIGRLDGAQLLKRDPMSDAKLLAASHDMVKSYEQVKNELIAPCEVPGHQFCAVGYFEAAKLAEGVADRLLTIKPPPTIDPAEAEKVTALVRLESQRLADESKAYAAQAEASLEQGVPDPETADLIRSYSQRARGRDPVGLPD